MMAEHPVLQESLAFKVFTQSPDDRFQYDKKEAEVSRPSYPQNFDKLYASVQNKMQMIFSHKIMPFSKEIAAIEDKTSKLEIPVIALTSSLGLWAQCRI